MIKFEEATKMKNDKIVETRLVCPCCNMGFIHINDEIDDRFSFPSERRKFIIPTNYPTCDRCGSKFEILIDRTLKIEIRNIKY